MKKYPTHIIALFAIGLLILTGCADEYSGGWLTTEKPVSMKIVLNLPVGAAPGAATRAASDELKAERRIDYKGIYLLIFQNNKLVEDVKEKQLSGENEGSRILTAKSENSYKGALDIVVLANVNKNGMTFNSSALIGKTKKEVYNSLIYTYGPQAWDVVNNDDQYIPMWGTFNLTPTSGENTANVGLYRAVSKINILVNKGNGLDNFTLTSARIYFANQQGYAAPLTEPTSLQPVASPSIAEDFDQSLISSPLLFEEPSGTNRLENRIYLPESNNQQPGNNKRSLCLVVGGKYKGAGLVEEDTESYYRIEFKDESGIYDALRNHLYVFNINSVSSPGTPSPEEALDHAVVGINVTIEAWSETSLNGLGSQYTLVTDKSRISLPQGGATMSLNVSSDHTDSWKIEEPKEKWFSYQVNGNEISITATANYGASREGSFYIVSGNIKKQIFVEQAQPGTANSYLVNPGDHEMTVVVKGNGTAGLYAEKADGTTKKLAESAILTPHHLSVIWETEAGLVQLYDHNSGNLVTKGATYNTEKGVLKYQVKGQPQVKDNNGNTIAGGNALIGAFDENNNILWSWHIWVCPEMVGSGNNNDQEWGLTKYKVMDRNLGALTNLPGVGSLGLLYQWGRKDPMIGAGSISANSGKMSTINHFETEEHVWKVANNDEASKTIDFTIKNPTKLIHDGLSLTDKDNGPFLWGTNGGLAQAGIKDLGKKTIYDPCPVGYRVPPVDAFVFKGETRFRPKLFVTDPYNGMYDPKDVIRTEKGESRPFSEFTGAPTKVKGPARVIIDNIESILPEGEEITVGAGKNLTWFRLNVDIPILGKSSETKNWQENLVYIPYDLIDAKDQEAQWSNDDYLYFYTKHVSTQAPYYGYYLNYNKLEVPKMKSRLVLETEKSNLTWIPLSGAYDPNKGFTFEGVEIEEGPSLTVNSFIWTNSSVTSDDGKTRPGAMFLHGANPKDIADGRHIHALNKGDIKAEPHYAGAVRCVRDVKKDFGDENKVPETIDLAKEVGSIVTSEIISINDSWQIIDPGAPWVSITPDRGIADKGRGAPIVFTATQENNKGAVRTTTVKIQIGKDDIREIKVSQSN